MLADDTSQHTSEIRANKSAHQPCNSGSSQPATLLFWELFMMSIRELGIGKQPNMCNQVSARPAREQRSQRTSGTRATKSAHVWDANKQVGAHQSHEQTSKRMAKAHANKSVHVAAWTGWRPLRRCCSACQAFRQVTTRQECPKP